MNTKLRSPIAYFGGKGHMVSKLVKLIPEHKTYVEPFGGGASLLLNKPPSPIEVYNDIDSSLVNLFRVLRDPEKFEKFYQKVCLTPYSREEFYFCRENLNCEDEVEWAYRFFVKMRMGFSGTDESWSFGISRSMRGMIETCSRWLSVIEMLPEIHSRLMRVQIEHRDFRDIFKTYDTPETFFYCDPPYISETRKRQDVYAYEMTMDDHRDLVQILLQLNGKAILSGYSHPIYEDLEKEGWQRLDFKTVCSAAAKTRFTNIQSEGSATEKVPRIESIWLSPNIKSLNLFEETNEKEEIER